MYYLRGLDWWEGVSQGEQKSVVQERKWHEGRPGGKKELGIFDGLKEGMW